MTQMSFYQESLIAHEILSDPLIKNAGILSTIKDSITNYFEAHNDPNDKVGTLLNFIAPGAISMLIGGWLGPTFGLAMRVLNIDIASILRSIYDGIKSILTGKSNISSSDIDGIIQSSLQQHTGQELQTNSFEQNIKDAQFLKLAVIALHTDQITVEQAKLSFGASRKARTVTVLGKLLSWVFKAAAASAGLMVAGDAVNKIVGRPNAFDHTIQNGKPVEQTAVKTMPVTTQTRFPVNSGYQDTKHSGTWIENYPNTKSGIENMLIDFSKSVYQGLDNLDSQIKSVPGFQATVHEIEWFNHAATGGPIVFIPNFFTSKKQIVDHFIDQVAQKA